MGFRFDPAVVEAKNQERGWNLAALAEAAGVSIPTAHRVLRGVEVSAATANKVKDAYARTRPKAALVELLSKEAAS